MASQAIEDLLAEMESLGAMSDKGVARRPDAREEADTDDNSAEALLEQCGSLKTQLDALAEQIQLASDAFASFTSAFAEAVEEDDEDELEEEDDEGEDDDNDD